MYFVYGVHFVQELIDGHPPIADDRAARPQGLVDRIFEAARRNRRWMEWSNQEWDRGQPEDETERNRPRQYPGPPILLPQPERQHNQPYDGCRTTNKTNSVKVWDPPYDGCRTSKKTSGDKAYPPYDTPGHKRWWWLVSLPLPDPSRLIPLPHPSRLPMELSAGQRSEGNLFPRGRFRPSSLKGIDVTSIPLKRLLGRTKRAAPARPMQTPADYETGVPPGGRTFPRLHENVGLWLSWCSVGVMLRGFLETV